MPEAKYKRVLLKLSGEALRGKSSYGINNPTLNRIALQIKEVVKLGVGVGIVVGGGNIWRGAQAEADGMDRVTADYAGMLATVINAIALQDVLERLGVDTRTQSALEIEKVAEPYIRRRAIRHLEKGRVVIFAGGTGNPYMTADTAGALRAIEINAEILLMTKSGVDGIYDADPNKNPKAKKIDKITHIKALSMRLKVMDTTALSLCMDNKLPIIVFDSEAKDGILKAVLGKSIGTLVTSEN
ncbi:MAG: UMP kinase [Chloroflexi bacterium RBG_13_51_52]|nr:MAG: UMP kinase [Chloroflexi bacterium RBG_13_51_52]